ncbi:LLM class flavin-dependent oxidoreductase [Acidisoma cellulosilytica]|uniref:LLM class flavin-dependent oxidoreductase n=1 Tax=Acidisoma cellulosilyticum TaxID=2802395 RepID=A0A963Z7C1_9PROT|nr:LLM class flavin-dependent oxidoreductase [Acidisoma cellulosilyticum]MCB8883903.1 LLM class flavin-dependent oxidoreductase [Acidisoma cellulosilyticum]
MTQQMHLGAFLFNLGNHIAGWRMPGVPTEGLMEFEFYRNLAETAERGKFDLIFHSDGLGINDSYDTVLRHTVAIRPEPLTLLSALSVVTKRVGLAATISTSYNEPYHIARKLGMLDFLSHGRAALNLVTSSTDQEAQNFGQIRHLSHAARYERAREFVDILKLLWDSWEDGAVMFDKESGRVADPARIHAIDFRGKYLSVRGPLNIPRPPQGHPIIIQAGVSADGQDFAAHVADIVFSVERSLASAQSFYAAAQKRVVAAGRRKDAMKIMPGPLPIIGRTQAEADAKDRALQDLVPESLAVSYLSDIVQHDLTHYPIDGPLPDLPASNGEMGRRQMILDEANVAGTTIRSLAVKMVQNRGHLRIVGTAVKIADFMEDWFKKGACDGFNILAPFHPGALEEFVDEVVPELQHRGLFRKDYQGITLRDHLGLPRCNDRNRT